MPDVPVSQQRTRIRVSEGVYRDRWGYEAKVQVGPHQRAKRWPLDTKVKTMQAWRNETRVSLQRLAEQELAERPGPFAEDVRTYLQTVTHLPTFGERKRVMGLWVALFGDRTRASLTSEEIQAVLSGWLADGLAVSTVAHRRSALSHLYRLVKQDKKLLPNVVRDTQLPSEPKPAARGLDYRTIERILKAMPALGRSYPGETRSHVNRTAARLRLIAYVGLPHKLVMQLRPEDVDLKAKTLRVQPRRKGGGAAGAILPLTPKGVEAIRAFIKADAWGPFSQSAMYASFQRACRALGLLGLRPYDLRHSFGTFVYGATGDLQAVSKLMTHADMKTTARYTRGAEFARMKAATKAAGEALSRIPVAVPRGSTRPRAKRPA